MPTVPLAAFDFVPVIVAGAAFLLLAGAVARRRPDLLPIALAGASLAAAGGASRATWKVVYAAGGPDLDVLFAALFPLLSAGFALMALALFCLEDRGAPNRSAVGLVALIWGTAFGLSFVGAATGFFITIVTLAEVVLVVLVWRWARHEGASVGWLVGIHLFLVIGLSGMARAVEQTVALQWVEESVNLVTQALLLIAILRLRAALDRNVPEPESAHG